MKQLTGYEPSSDYSILSTCLLTQDDYLLIPSSVLSRANIRVLGEELPTYLRTGVPAKTTPQKLILTTWHPRQTSSPPQERDFHPAES